MFACTELVTGFDDFGKVIFLQSSCDRARVAGGSHGMTLCNRCSHHDTYAAQPAIAGDDDTPHFQQVLQSLLEAPFYHTNVFPLR